MINNNLLKRLLSSLILIPLALFFTIKGSFLFNFFISICFFISAYEWFMMSKNRYYNFFGLIFLIFSFYSIYQLRNNFNDDYIYLLLIALICVSTDVGGYIFGNLIKGPKITKISPNKTYSGMIGSYLLSILSVNLFFYFSYTFTETMYKFLIFTLIVSTFSQLGDLTISYFKRLSKIKDTGKIIPGHGGILDRIDGMIFAFPLSFLILKTNFFQYF
tara:strand:- start:181 stop:831 length:651 start_codon:yes stop_codon:yes gene_type:complete